MVTNEFTNRLIPAGETARTFAASFVPEPLLELLCYTLARFDNPQGRRVPPHGVASLFWFDGKVPAWINIGVCDSTERETELMIHSCHTLLPADEDKLPPGITGGLPPVPGCVP